MTLETGSFVHFPLYRSGANDPVPEGLLVSKCLRESVSRFEFCGICHKSEREREKVKNENGKSEKSAKNTTLWIQIFLPLPFRIHTRERARGKIYSTGLWNIGETDPQIIFPGLLPAQETLSNKKYGTLRLTLETLHQTEEEKERKRMKWEDVIKAWKRYHNPRRTTCQKKESTMEAPCKAKPANKYLKIKNGARRKETGLLSRLSFWAYALCPQRCVLFPNAKKDKEGKRKFMLAKWKIRRQWSQGQGFAKTEERRQLEQRYANFHGSRGLIFVRMEVIKRS